MRSALAFVATALALSSCGGDRPRDSAKDFSGVAGAVAATVEDMEEAARNEDEGRLCTKLLSDSLLAAVEEEDIRCETAVREAFQDADSLDLTVEDVSITGDTATARVTSGRGSNEKTNSLQLEKSGAVWKISALRI